jgi:hypothetical protein
MGKCEFADSVYPERCAENNRICEGWRFNTKLCHVFQRAKRQAAEQEVERLRTAIGEAVNKLNCLPKIYLPKVADDKAMEIMRNLQAALATPQDISSPETGDLSSD